MSILSRFRKAAPAVETKGLADPEPWLFELFGAVPTLAGITVTPYTAMTCAPVACAIRAISEAIGQLPLHVYKTLPDGGKAKATDHPLYRLLHDAPNSWTPSALFRSQVTADALLQPYGGFAQIVRVGDKVHEIIRLDPALSSIIVDYSNFEPQYAVKADGKSAASTIPASDIIHLHTPAYNPSRGLVGEARETIALALILEKNAARLFSKRTTPGGVVTLKDISTPDGIAKMRAAWKAVVGGAENTGETVFLPADMTWQNTTMTSVDAQFLEMRNFTISDIARVFRVSPHMLAQLERATMKNVESLGQEFLSQTLLPWIKRWEQELALKLLTQEERDQFVIEFNLDGFARADLLARSQALSAAVAARILSPNEARAIGFNLPAYEGGDTYENFNTSSAHAGGKLNGPSNDNQNDPAHV
ncbi:phage portal protein [Bradyrhizobium sp. 33ap4]|uniref:phage portal protein n=1 Tax=Bradyrhizobium sp. 33ap4 TaxID=3061630 RepID=UPI00293119FF|nr:phage portal protein [Bradyrhizobium sp. 33ap4]